MHTIQVASGNCCLDILLAAASPLQAFFDHPATTHEFCNHQGLRILRNDGFEDYADFLQGYCKEMNMGVNWADKGWKNIHHYFDPVTKRGLWHFAGALSVFEQYYQLSLRLAGQRQFRRAVFFMGAAAHLVQDVCVPHHARAKLFDGHKQFGFGPRIIFPVMRCLSGGFITRLVRPHLCLSPTQALRPIIMIW